METMQHPFERSGLGKSPFRCIDCRENRGTCAYCGTGILYEYVIKSADGKQFVVGCDCVRKTGAVVAEFRKHRLEFARQRRHAQTEARRAERRAAVEEIRKVERAEREQAFTSANHELVTRLRAYNGTNSFLQSMVTNLNVYGSLTERMTEVVTRMFAEQDRAEVARTQSQWIGAIGLRQREVRAKVISCKKLDSYQTHGYDLLRTLVKLETPEGNQLTWFTGRWIDLTDDFVSVTFTVKDHSEYDGIKQTVVTRLLFN